MHLDKKENCTLCKPKVVQIQTEHGVTLTNTTHLCHKTYYVCGRLGEVWLTIVKAYVLSGLEHDLLAVKALTIQGMQSIIILIQSNLECML